MTLQTQLAVSLAAEHIANATGLLILAGAGMGVDSGLPDYRGNAGFWRAYPVLREANVKLDDIATPQSFVDDPDLAWGFYGHRIRLYRDTKPHEGFGILLRWGEAMGDGWWAQTTNVDGQFQRAGFDPRYLHEIHGTLHELQCAKPCTDDTWSADRLEPAVDSSLRWHGWPVCRRCGGVTRPNVLMFQDSAWNGTAADAKHWQLLEWLDTVERLVVIEIGAGTAIPTLRQTAQRLVQRRAARLVRINLREADVELPGAVGLSMGALDGLRAIQSALGESGR